MPIAQDASYVGLRRADLARSGGVAFALTVGLALWSPAPALWVAGVGVGLGLLQGALWFLHDAATHPPSACTAADADKQARFLGVMGHELRTPLNAIMGFHSVMRSHWANDPDALARVDRMQHTSARLLLLLHRLLDHAKLRAHRVVLQPQPLALLPLLQACVHDMTAHAQAQGVQLLLDAPQAHEAWVQADPVRLKQTVCCALDVALAAHHGGTLTLVVTHTAERWRFVVRADAPARTPAASADVTLAREVGARLVALQHGTDDWAPSPATDAVWLSLPLPAVPAPATADPQQCDALREHAWRVLVVDDHELNRVVATLTLRTVLPHVRVSACDSGAAALDWLRAHPCDLVLMDILMPDQDGLSTTRALRAQDGPQAHTPVLAITGIDQPEDRMACLQAGMQGVLLKPLRAEALMTALLAVLPPRGPA